jgi:hypothetical protein
MTASVLIFENGLTLLAQLEEVGGDIGEPDCMIVKPFLINADGTLSPWLVDATSQDTFKVHSDKILTICEPKPTLLEKYQDLIK